jgi:hypothetical protein
MNRRLNKQRRFDRQIHSQTLVRNGAKTAKPKTRPTGAVFTYRSLKVKTHLKAGLKID